MVQFLDRVDWAIWISIFLDFHDEVGVETEASVSVADLSVARI